MFTHNVPDTEFHKRLLDNSDSDIEEMEEVIVENDHLTPTELDVLVQQLTLKSHELYDCRLLLEQAKKNGSSEATKKAAKTYAPWILLGLGYESGFGYLLYDLISRCLKETDLLELWNNVTIPTYGDTCGQIYTPFINPYCSTDITLISDCAEISDEYCSETSRGILVSESLGAALSFAILIPILVCQATMIIRLIPYFRTDATLTLQDSLIPEDLDFLLEISNKYQLNIIDTMSIKEAINAIKQDTAKDKSSIKEYLQLKQLANLFYHICQSNNARPALPPEIAKEIIQYIKEEAIFESKEPERAEKEDEENEEDQNDSETIDVAKQKAQTNICVFNRFFAPIRPVKDFNPRKADILESNVLRVFK